MDISPEKLVMQLEVDLFDRHTRKSKEKLDELIADDFIEFTSSGRVTTKKETVSSLLVEQPIEITASNLQAKTLDERCILLTYEARKTDSNGSVKDSFRSSIWRKNGSNWQIVFHQGTLKK